MNSTHGSLPQRGVNLAKDSCVDADLLDKMYPKLAHWKLYRSNLTHKEYGKATFPTIITL